MSSGLAAPLSPEEEIALRRIAYGSLNINAKVAARLIDLALVQRASSGLHLTPLGRQRYNALPKAPLLGQQRSLHAVSGYVEGLIEKAQGRAAKQAPATAPSRPLPLPALPEGRVAVERADAADELPAYQSIYVFFDSEHWKARAERRMKRMRRNLLKHRHRQVSLCETSHQRIESSLALLKASVPRRPHSVADAE
jgi:hypothetical protein